MLTPLLIGRLLGSTQPKNTWNLLIQARVIAGSSLGRRSRRLQEVKGFQTRAGGVMPKVLNELCRAYEICSKNFFDADCSIISSALPSGIDFNLEISTIKQKEAAGEDEGLSEGDDQQWRSLN
ncbi:unnamed protein product [Dovyalis caffra]|uniref:Uncharacterized protein n=1 Tax=Dovyalis caffra TaxID=77055 RepID=A0AAV1S1K7_9ROSI|nr:unnamed protein product [Dovyalis caffra]